MACQPNEIIPSPRFIRDIGNLRKAHRSVDSAVCEIIKEEICPDPLSGDAIKGFAGRIRKSRVPNPDSNLGKRGGFRLIYDWNPGSKTLCLLCLFSKKDTASLANAEVAKARNSARIK